MQNILIASNGTKTCLMVDGKLVQNVTAFSFNATPLSADLSMDFIIRPTGRELSTDEGLEMMTEILGYKLCAE